MASNLLHALVGACLPRTRHIQKAVYPMRYTVFCCFTRSPEPELFCFSRRESPVRRQVIRGKVKFPKRHYIFHSEKCKKGARKKQKYIIRNKIEEKREESWDGVRKGSLHSVPLAPGTPGIVRITPNESRPM